MVPWITSAVRAGGFVVTVDVKGAGAEDDLATIIGADFKASGISASLLRTWDYTRSDSVSWNPLDELVTDRAYEVATRSLLGRPPESERDRFFYQRDYRWLRAILHLAKEGSVANLGDLNVTLATRDRLADFVRPIRSRWTDDIADLLEYDSYDYSRTIPGLLNTLHLFTLTDVRRITTTVRPESGPITGSRSSLTGRLLDETRPSSLRFGRSLTSRARSSSHPRGEP